MIARFLALLAAAAALVTSTAVAASPAGADTIGLCTATHGTIVAVDFSHWGGPIVRGCGVDSKTGYELLHDGGFTSVGDQHDGPRFICRLGNGAFRGGTQYPTPDQDACVVTPPASAYWSYWLAPRDQNTWSYSQLGAMSDVPQDGEVELWQFGSTNVAGTDGRPAVSPDSLRAKNSSPVGAASTPRTTSATKNHSTVAAHSTPAVRGRSVTAAARSTTPDARASSTPTTRASSGAATTATTASGHSSGAKPRSSTAAATSSGDTSSAVTSGTSPSGTGSRAAPAIVDASPAGKSTATPPGSGSPAALIVGGGLVIVLAAGAGWAMVRRRRTDPDV